MLLLYNLVLRVYGFGILLASVFNTKAKLWIKGRKNLLTNIDNSDFSGQWIWMHVASLGEFEQGRPLLEEIKKQFPRYRILLSFFSPSGYTVRKDYHGADYVCYLPLDTPKNAQRFIGAVNPGLAVFVKYDIWYHYLKCLQAHAIPNVLISGEFRAGQLYFRPYGTVLLNVLRKMSHVFTQTEQSAALLLSYGATNVSVAGDTRIDRVLKITAGQRNFTLPEWIDKTYLIIGSCWHRDDQVYMAWVNGSEHKIVIAPHQTGNARVRQLKAQITRPCVTYTDWLEDQTQEVDVLILDTIGMLSYLYRFAQVAYIGGGFGSGIHNTLEPAAYHLPVIFGPRFQKFVEARHLVSLKAASSVSNADEFEAEMKALESAQTYKLRAQKTARWIQSNQGATQKIMAYLAHHNYLENADD